VGITPLSEASEGLAELELPGFALPGFELAMEEVDDDEFCVPFAVELIVPMGDAKGVSVLLLAPSALALEHAARTAHAESKSPPAILRQRTRRSTLLSSPLEHERPKHCSSRMLR
jgi:hypothetical protein